MLARKALAGTAGAPKVYVEDVFSTYLYTGNASTQTITNNIDLSSKGGLVWIKSRSNALANALIDTVRGREYVISSNLTDAEYGPAPSDKEVTSFNSDGFSLGTNYNFSINTNAATYASWTFRKAKKFFDVVTYTGNGTTQAISHNLGSTPGCIIVKRTDASSAVGWFVYHRSLGASERIFLNLTDASANNAASNVWGNNTTTVNPTSTNFTIGNNSNINTNNGTYVAYLFAHDAGGFGDAGDQNVISCGSYTTDAGGDATVTLGFEPQWVLSKRTNAVDDWHVTDIMRGATVVGSKSLYPNLSSAEETTTSGVVYTNATGFTASRNASSTYIYIAIRRGPMKTPTDATKVFTPTVYTGTNVDNRLVDTTIAPDMVIVRQRNDTVLGGMVVGDRLRGQPYLLTGADAAEVNDADSFDAQIVSTTEYGTAFSAMNGFWCGNDATSKLNANTTSNNHVVEAFKRAPGFFDIVCYTGTGSSRTVTHNLGVTPELMLVKNRSEVYDWRVYSAETGGTKYLILNSTAAAVTSSGAWNDTAPTSSVFTVGDSLATNKSGNNIVAYLFASLSGISKVGSYTGNGSSVTITTNFQPRFILVKRTDSTGDWIVSDSARGLVAGSDPYLLLNSTAAEDTDEDWVDVTSTSFTVNQTTAANANVNTGTYIYLAIA